MCLLSSVLPRVRSLQLLTDSSSALTLNCISTSSPALSVVWLKDGASLDNTTSYSTTQVLRNGISATYDNILEIDAAPAELVGAYSCIVHDSLRRNSQTAAIQVNGMSFAASVCLCKVSPKYARAGLQISGYRSQYSVGDVATIECSFDLNSTSIEWLYNNEVIMSTEDAQLNLTFSPVHDTVHNRQYTCRVSTSYGVQERNITIRVEGNTLATNTYKNTKHKIGHMLQFPLTPL